MTKRQSPPDEAAPELQRLVDNGYAVAVFRNGMGTYTAFAVPVANLEDAIEAADEHEALTDDFTPSRSVKRLADKVHRVGEYEGWTGGPDFDEDGNIKL